MSVLVAPSLLSADFLHLESQIEMINQSEADWLHLDIMDGVFVPNISYGFPVIDVLGKTVKKTLDAHLMIIDPQKYITRFRDAGINILSVHYETCPHLHAVISQIREAGMKPGLVLNPHTPVEVLTDILDDLYLVLVMSVNPGFGGQKFIPHSVEKVRRLKQLIRERELNTLIEVDGGINMETGKQVVDAGADALVAGNFVFHAQDPAATIRQMKSEL